MIQSSTISSLSSLRRVVFAHRRGALALALWFPVVAGCAAPSVMRMEAQRYKIDVQLDPVTHTIRGQATLDLVRREGEQSRPGPVAIELLLHRDLKLTAVRGGGASARRITIAPPAAQTNDESKTISPTATPRSHWVRMEQPVESMTLFVNFEGKLHQDIAAGEKPGQIHNFEMQAHIGEEGIYLADGYWYPQPALPAGAIPPLSHFTLLAAAVPEMALVASGDEDDDLGEQIGKQVWQSPYPIPRMVLVGGRHAIRKETYKGVEIAVHLNLSDDDQAEGLLAAAKKNFDRYVPLMGPYPAKQYTIVENFFSSGFAFPCFTLLSSAVIQMGERGWGRHGYLDHEFLHSWWGCGVQVDPRDGNWCESLASYGANYYGYVLDGDEEGARKKRRNICHFLSRIKPEDDKPLGTYELPGGCSRTIAYDKGAMVFHMLERKMGEKKIWEGLQEFNKSYLGEYATWSDLQRILERIEPETSECGTMKQVNFDLFFSQWVRGKGAPEIKLEAAYRIPYGLVYDLSQDPPFEIDDLPLGETDLPMMLVSRFLYDPFFLQGLPKIDWPRRTSAWEVYENVRLPFEHIEKHVQLCTPITVELDPGFHVFRKIPSDQILPTTTSTRSGETFTSVVPAGNVPEQLQKLSGVFGSSYKTDQRRVKTADQVKPDEDLAERCVLILGDAARDPVINAFLAAIDFPIRWTEQGFAIEDQEFDDPGHAVLCTVRHPGVPGGGVTVVFGNSDQAIPRAALIPFYQDSMVVFKDGIPVLRRDFEPRSVINVREPTKP